MPATGPTTVAAVTLDASPARRLSDGSQTVTMLLYVLVAIACGLLLVAALPTHHMGESSVGFALERRRNVFVIGRSQLLIVVGLVLVLGGGRLG